ncbi:MAG: hypothetical protein V1912_11350 [bacterium]
MSTAQDALTRALREPLAALEHEQWMAWAQSIMQSEEISKDRTGRWTDLMVSYTALTEREKDQDRKWADRVLTILAALPDDVLVSRDELAAALIHIPFQRCRAGESGRTVDGPDEDGGRNYIWNPVYAADAILAAIREGQR